MSRVTLVMNVIGCYVLPGFSAEAEKRERGWKFWATMKVLNCRKNEACDEVEETMGVLSTPQDYLSLGQHTG